MQKPHLQISIQNGVLKIIRSSNGVDEPFLILEVEIEDLKVLQPAEAAHRIGGTVLNLLRTWHKSDFGDWIVLPVFDGLGKDSEK
jgi:hypothetical protein